MEVTVRCHQCGGALPVTPSGESADIDCGRCRQGFTLSFSSAVRSSRSVDRCPVCQGADFYLRKDFNPQIGVTIVVVGALVSAGFYYFGLDLVAYGILAGATLIDLAIYSRLSDLTVCYRCFAEFRGDYERTAGPFELHTADVLEPEYERRIGKR